MCGICVKPGNYCHIIVRLLPLPYLNSQLANQKPFLLSWRPAILSHLIRLWYHGHLAEFEYGNDLIVRFGGISGSFSLDILTMAPPNSPNTCVPPKRTKKERLGMRIRLLLITSVTEFSLVIGSPWAYLSRSRQATRGCSVATFCSWIPVNENLPVIGDHHHVL